MRNVLPLVLMLTACGSATDNDIAARSMLGNWSYDGVQTTPTALTVRGTLRIDQQSGNEFSGTATFSETDVQGTRRDRTGQLSGRVLGSNAVDFDIFIEESARRHVGGISMDSMSGDWARTASIPQVRGKFSARLMQ